MDFTATVRRFVLVLAIAAWTSAWGTARADQVLFDFSPGFDLKSVEARDAKAAISSAGSALAIATGTKEPWPGITLKVPAAQQDLSAFGHVAMEVKNVGKTAAEVRLRIDSQADSGARQSVEGGLRLPPGEKKTVTVTLKRPLPPALKGKLFGMRGNPGGVEEGKGIDARRVSQVLVFVVKPSAEHALEIERIRAGGDNSNYAWLELGEAKLFPMIDRFGQFIHKDWPGKTHAEADFQRRKAEETADWAAQPGPSDWDQYGGWKGGPQLKATGFFRAEKHQGKWWLVDPEGRLFWSHGVDCVRANSPTPITDREHWYQGLPERDSPFGQFYGRGKGAAHDYYQNKSFDTFDFYGANLLRKYGDDFSSQFTDAVHRRLRSWGLNTIGNWSGAEVYLRHKTPYVATIRSARKPIEGSSGYWGKFPDPFDPEFRAALAKNLAAERGKTAGDPWCLGYFIDNELGWGDELSLAESTLASPPAQEAKKVFLADLKAKYASIEKLNQAWGTSHASWDALLESQKAPDRKAAREDLAAFYTRIAEQYFRECRDAIHEAAPGQLYLGCRFAWANDRAIRAAGKYCDVVSFNFYTRSIADRRLPQGVDLPVIVGEFHFGALDRGMFHTGLVSTASQAERAATYLEYLKSGLTNPMIVGTHWFQFVDQATTGRADGENYQIGLVDICDTPYPETIRAVREIGATMYEVRLSGK